MGHVIYAQTSARRARQVTGDVFVLTWVATWCYIATVVHRLVAALAEPARALAQSGTEFDATIREAGDKLLGIPWAGTDLKGVFGRIAGIGAEASATGTAAAQTIEQLALVLALVVVAAPALGLAIPWVSLRVRFVRRAAAARQFIDADADLDLFALRALAHQPMPRLARISDDPTGAWRRGDPQITRALAELELHDAGILPPPLRPDAEKGPAQAE